MLARCLLLAFLPACSLIFDTEASEAPVGDGGVVPDGAAPADSGVDGEPGLSLTWHRHMTGQDSVELNDIAASSGGDVYVAGLFQESLKFDDASDSITGGGLAEIFVGRILSSGDGDWLITVPATSRASAAELDFSGGNLMVAGIFDDTINNFGTVTSAGGNDLWWANVALTSGSLSSLKRAGSTSGDFVRGLIRLAGEPLLAATLGGQADFFGTAPAPLGGSDVYVGTTTEGQDVFRHYGGSGSESVIDLSDSNAGPLLLIEHDSSLAVEGTNLAAPAADGVSVVQHAVVEASSAWGVTVADLQLTGHPTLQFNNSVPSPGGLVAGLGQGTPAIVGGDSVDLANRTGWMVLLNNQGDILSRILVRSDFTAGIVGSVLDNGHVAVAVFVDGGTPGVDVDGTIFSLGATDAALVIFVVDASQGRLISELVFPVEGSMTPIRLLSAGNTDITFAGQFDGSITLPSGDKINAFNSGFPDSIIMHLQLGDEL